MTLPLLRQVVYVFFCLCTIIVWIVNGPSVKSCEYLQLVFSSDIRSVYFMDAHRKKNKAVALHLKHIQCTKSLFIVTMPFMSSVEALYRCLSCFLSFYIILLYCITCPWCHFIVDCMQQYFSHERKIMDAYQINVKEGYTTQVHHLMPKHTLLCYVYHQYSKKAWYLYHRPYD